MAAEETHEIGREGVLKGQLLLWRLFGNSIKLPFNAYDHGPKLRFSDVPEGTFNYDLGGSIERPNPNRFSKFESTDIFVEVKAYQHGKDLLAAYAEFLRHAAVMSTKERHRDTWFVFLASVPFGCSKGIELCNGQFLDECQMKWPEPLKAHAGNLHLRVCLLIATASFERMLLEWSR